MELTVTRDFKSKLEAYYIGTDILSDGTVVLSVAKNLYDGDDFVKKEEDVKVYITDIGVKAVATKEGADPRQRRFASQQAESSKVEKVYEVQGAKTAFDYSADAIAKAIEDYVLPIYQTQNGE